MPNERQLPQYKCHKIVGALKIKKLEPLPIFQGGGARLTFEEDGYEPIEVSEHWFAKHKPTAGTYYVVYEDNYESISPSEAFEKGYSRI